MVIKKYSSKCEIILGEFSVVYCDRNMRPMFYSVSHYHDIGIYDNIYMKQI